MPIRRIHFTGRKRLRSRDIDIKVNDDKTPPTFDIVKLDLDDYGLPADARVYVDANRQTSYMRFPCGTVGNRVLPEDRKLTDFVTPEVINFRVKVTSAAEPRGQLLAESPGMSDSRVDSLLPVRPDSDLGEEVFRLDFTDPDGPVMLINERLDEWKAVVAAPYFAALVYPGVLRTILARVIHVEEHTDSDDRDDWRSQWLRLAKTYNAPDPPPPVDGAELVDEWIDDVAKAFSKDKRSYRDFVKYYLKEADE